VNVEPACFPAVCDGGSPPPARPPMRAAALGRASLVSWRGRFMNRPLTRPSRPVLIVAISQECRALRLLYSDMATGRQ